MVELWHERLLQWAIAEGLVSGLRARRLTPEGLCDRVRSCIEGEGGRRFGYVPMDVLWLLADPAAPRERGDPRAPAALRGDRRPCTSLDARRSDLPHVFARLRRIGEESSYLEIHYLKVLKSMSDPSIAGFAVEMLSDSRVRLQKIAARILTTHGSPEALDRLWALYRAWSAEVEARRAGTLEEGEVRFHDVVQADEALGSCVRLASGWLEKAILTANSATDPVHTLVFLIPKVEHGGELWQRIKRVAFSKVRPEHERSLAVCIIAFHDHEEVSWLDAAGQ